MTNLERFTSLITAVVIVGGVAIKLLWDIRGAWDATNGTIRTLSDAFSRYILESEREHKRLHLRDDKLEERFNDHVGRHRR